MHKGIRMLGALTMAAALTLSACGGSSESAGSSAAETAAGYGFTYEDHRYVPGMDAEEALSLLGEPTASRDVNNCARGAVRKAYSYGAE